MHARRPRIAAVALALLAPTLAVGQEPGPPVPTFSAESGTVNVSVVVLDKKGKLVTGLTRNDFVVYEDDRRVDLSLFGRAFTDQAAAGTDDDVALDLGLMMDTSESMIRPLKLSQEAASRFLESIPRARELYTIFFGEEIRVSRYDSESQQGLYERIHGLRGGGNTALYDAVAVYLSRVQGQSGRKVLVIFSDGEDSTSELSFGELLRLVRASPVTIYPIAFMEGLRPGSGRAMRGLSVLRELAELTGGQVFAPNASRDLADIYKKLLEELGAQYVLGYVSPDPTPDGRFRRLRVELKGGRKDLRLRYRPGYLVPQEAAAANAR